MAQKNSKVGEWKFKLLKFLARHRTAAVAITGPLPFALLNLGFRYHYWQCFILSIVAYSLLIVAAIAPHQYASVLQLEMILRSLHQILSLDKEKDRITIHHKKGTGEYEQITNYFPTVTGQGRSFVLGKGIVGRCFSYCKPRSTSLPTGITLIEFAKKDWGFNQDEASRLTQDRQSFYAFPIGQDSGFATAVIYMDSPDPARFTEANQPDRDEKIRTIFLPLIEEILKRVP